MAQNKWTLVLHDEVEDPYYELTNSQITLCANCGYVGETEDEEDAIFKKVVDTLNESGIDWHSENKLELDQHIEIMQLQDNLRRERETWQDLHKGYNKALEERELKANLLADAIAQYFNAPKGQYMYYRMKLQNALQQWNEGKALSEYNQSKGGEKV